MVEFYVGEIKLFSCQTIPQYWHICDGSQLQANQYQALFAVIGTTYGGNGNPYFNLPDLRGRTPVGAAAGGAYGLGATGGVETVTLTSGQLPLHNHNFMCTAQPGNVSGIVNAVYGVVTSPTAQNLYTLFDGGAMPVALDSSSLANTGGNQPHTNIQPSLALVFCIATAGIFPPRPN